MCCELKRRKNAIVLVDQLESWCGRFFVVLFNLESVDIGFSVWTPVRLQVADAVSLCADIATFKGRKREEEVAILFGGRYNGLCAERPARGLSSSSSESGGQTETESSVHGDAC